MLQVAKYAHPNGYTPDASELRAYRFSRGHLVDAGVKEAEVGALKEEGDALLLCTEGFWRYVYETEMEIDLCKAANSQEWLETMLLRLVQRTFLQSGSLAVTTMLYEGGDGDEL